MSTLSPGTAVVASRDVVFRELEGESILLNLETGIYFGLDPVGSRIWQLVQDQRTIAAICDAVGREYDVDDATLEHDVIALVTTLAEKSLVEVVS
jgi:hypothetical protein